MLPTYVDIIRYYSQELLREDKQELGLADVCSPLITNLKLLMGTKFNSYHNEPANIT